MFNHKDRLCVALPTGTFMKKGSFSVTFLFTPLHTTGCSLVNSCHRHFIGWVEVGDSDSLLSDELLSGLSSRIVAGAASKL